MRNAWTILVLAACGNGGRLGPDDDAVAIATQATEFPVAFGDGGAMAFVDQQGTDYSGTFCSARIRNIDGTVTGFTTGINDMSSKPCLFGAGVDLQGRVFLSAAAYLTVGALSGPWANFYLGARGACAPTELSDGTYVGCTDAELVAVSPDGALVFRAAVGGAPKLGLISDDRDTVFALVAHEDGSWRLVAVDPSGGVAFDVPAGVPQDTPSFGNDGAVLLSALTDAGAAVQVFDPENGAVKSEVSLDNPARSVVVAEDGDWILAEKGVAANVPTDDDTLVRMSPAGDVLWTRAGERLGWPIVDDQQRVWVSAMDELLILTDAGRDVDAFPLWGSHAAGPPVIRDGWFGATYDASGRVVRLGDTDVGLASTGWPRAGGSNRNDGRRPTP